MDYRFLEFTEELYSGFSERTIGSSDLLRNCILDSPNGL